MIKETQTFYYTKIAVPNLNQAVPLALEPGVQFDILFETSVFFMRYLDEILWWFIIGGFLLQRCIWHPLVWLGLSRKVVSMHLALRANAFGFTANTRVNASHAQNLLIHFCTVSSGDVYSSSYWSEIDFQTSQSLTHKTILTNSDRKTGTNAAATARIVHLERCIDICQCIFDSHPCYWHWLM